MAPSRVVVEGALPSASTTLHAGTTRGDARSDDAARWLCLTIFALPFAQTLTWDFDRAAPLAFAPVALWLGGPALKRALGRLSRSPAVLRATLLLTGMVTALSVVNSPQPAAAGVMLASWILLGGTALVAGQIVAEKPERGRWMLAALAASGAVAALVHWTQWRAGGSAESAFYPHHRIMGLHLLGSTLAATSLLHLSSGWKRFTWLVGGMICWGGLLWTGSRAPAGAVILSLGIWMLIGRRAERLRLLASTTSHVTGGVVVSLLLDAKVDYLGIARFWRRTMEASSAKEMSSHRTDFWESGWQRAWEWIWTGRGPDAYRYLEPKLEGSQPHNVILQWLLDLGIFGAIALAVLLGWSLWRGLRRTTALSVAAGWPIIALASSIAGQLDGFFYHFAGFYTAALGIGISACGPAGPPISGPGKSGLWLSSWRIAAITSFVLLTVHAWLFHRVAYSPPPQPTDSIVRLWFAFPTTTAGLDRWVAAWSSSAPDAALALSKHAQRHSPNGDYFHVQTAGLLLRRGDRAGALTEMEYALAIVPWQRRELLEQLRDQVASGR